MFIPFVVYEFLLEDERENILVEKSLGTENNKFETNWTQGIAVGSKEFVEKKRENLAHGQREECLEDTRRLTSFEKGRPLIVTILMLKTAV